MNAVFVVFLAACAPAPSENGGKSTPALMPYAVAIAAMNNIKVRDLKGSPDKDLDSERLILWIVFSMSEMDTRTLETHWQVPMRGWSPATRSWRLEDHRDKTLRELLNEITETEGWNYKFGDGYLLVRRFHVSR